MELKVLTLNCWGVVMPGCQLRHERIEAIGRAIAKEEYDIVMLEEVWSQSDYQKLQQHIHPVMPHSHYFHSGTMGSGVCVFSRHTISETFLHRYTLNGYAHKIFENDWLCGKSVGLAVILCQGFRIYVYSTHMIAQYDEVKDDFLAHRVSQAYEMSQFIKTTSGGSDVIIAGGDFNLQPKDLGYKMIVANTGMHDSWLSQEAEVEDKCGATCDRPDNMFHSKHSLTYAPEGMRLDYLLYQTNLGVDMTCKKCYMTMGKVPDQPFPYSDHEGLAAVYEINRSDTATPPKRDSSAVECHFTEAIPILNAALKKAERSRILYFSMVVLGLFLWLYIATITGPWWFGMALGGLRIMLAFIIGYSFWMAVVLVNWEVNALLANKKDINNILKSNQ